MIATVKEKAAHVYELYVVEIPVGDGLIDILILADTLLEVVQRLLRQHSVHSTHPQSWIGKIYKAGSAPQLSKLCTVPSWGADASASTLPCRQSRRKLSGHPREAPRALSIP